MAYLTEQATYEPGIYQIECTDPIQGGQDGISNVQAKQLANRTTYIKSRFEAAHNVDGTHKSEALVGALAGALTDTEFATNANVNESKVNLYFRGTQRPSNMGLYSNTREIAEDIVMLDTMNSLGDLMLNKTTLDTARNLCNQFYSSSGVLYPGSAALIGHTPVTNGTIGGGIFTMDIADPMVPASLVMSNKLRIEGTIQYLIDGFCVHIKPGVIELPPADDVYRSTQRKDLVYIRTHLENVTLSNKFYRQGDALGEKLNWSVLSDIEKRVATVLIDNNLFIGADYNVYQLQYEWQVAANASTLIDVGYARDVSDSHMYLSGKYKAIEICNVTRRNKGAYHSVINPYGTGAFWGESEALDQNQITHSAVSYPITAVDVTNNTFTIAGEHAALFTIGTTINVSEAINGEDNNSRDYEIFGATNTAGSTVIQVTRNLTLNTGAKGAINKGWPASPFYSITDTDTVAQTFTIAGDRVAEFPSGHYIEVLGTTDNNANDKDYLVLESTREGANTLVKVNSVIFNTGNTGKLHALEWFHIDYCFNHVAMGMNEEYSGSVASGSVAASSDSTMAEFTKAHDHFINTDITDLRVYLATAERVTDPNCTLGAPVLTGVPLDVYELDEITMKIDPFSDILTYAIQALDASSGVAMGSIVRSGAFVTWHLTEIATDTVLRLSISAGDGAGHISPTQNYSVLARNLNIAGDAAVLVGSTGWESITGATVTSGFVATTDNAIGLSNYVYQSEGEADWAKYRAVVSRSLNKWTIAAGSTVSSLLLTGTRALTKGQLYAIKYAGNTSIVVTDLGVLTATWDSGTLTNTLALEMALGSIPEMIWSWDGTVAMAAGTSTEALVPETALVINSELTSTTQVVGSAALSRLWVNDGYHATVKIIVSGVEVEVPVLGVNEFSGTYTLQIPEQDAVPTTMVKPSCFKVCTNPLTTVYNSVTTNIDTVYPEQIVYDNSIRSIKFKVDMAQLGGKISVLQADMWSEL